MHEDVHGMIVVRPIESKLEKRKYYEEYIYLTATLNASYLLIYIEDTTRRRHGR